MKLLLILSALSLGMATAASAAPMALQASQAEAPAAGNVPICSKTVTDGCMQRSATGMRHDRSARHHRWGRHHHRAGRHHRRMRHHHHHRHHRHHHRAAMATTPPVAAPAK
ncbi:hypothetical protein NDN01_19745 [Sphingomonas sp. QA11]|uniref:hypothetical protein n=1 Tax=Sphingomonas sp. QA11 TaxID=2950605 RepID=UPI00234A5434|nr:hypothetical protein [Sphingomonas sp. QA11]WCM26217.1 hypothetical protein NDN01_19745 [Sphingomonas sp. QA11]